jgi:hypothetical protein
MAVYQVTQKQTFQSPGDVQILPQDYNLYKLGEGQCFLPDILALTFVISEEKMF